MPNTDEMPVFLVPYDDSWPRQFDIEAALIEASLDVQPVSIEHIGSTAIPGIAAKPIIDIMVLIDSIGDAQHFIDQLKTLEYHYHPYGEDIFPERRWHCKPNPRHRTHHLHLVERDSQFHFDHLLFRDYLRANRGKAVAYESLKISLAKQFPNDRESYTDGKSEFVGNILKKTQEAI